MQALNNLFSGTGSAPDKEPAPSLLSDWKSYQAGTSGPAAASSSQSDKLLASAEEGTSTVKGFLSNAATLVSSSVSGAVGSATSLPASLPSSTQWVYFAALFGGGVLFLLMAFFLFLPVLILAPAKFAMTFSIGSALIIASLGALKGWQAMFGHMFSKERMPFTAAYLGSLLGTLYAALMLHSYVFSVVCCVAQVCTLLYYVASYFPGGASGAQAILGGIGRGGFSLGGAVLRGLFSR